SDERGGWTLVLPGRRYYDNAPEVPPPNSPAIARPLTIRIHYPNAPALDLVENVELGTEHSVPNTALRGQVVGSGGSPIGGAVMSTSVSAATSVTRANGLWFL